MIVSLLGWLIMLSFTRRRKPWNAIIKEERNRRDSGIRSTYRGLGSIDFQVAARSVLLVGRLKKEPHIRVLIHDKSSLVPERRSMAFGLGTEEGFQWLKGYEEISAKELICCVSGETKL